mgnify:CR=1 FL=1
MVEWQKAHPLFKKLIVFCNYELVGKIFLWTYENLCGMLLYCKGGADMARITVEDVYGGEKYDVMSAVMADYLKNGRPEEYDERTWLDMLIVKYPLIAADKMKIEGDSISGMTDGESSSSYVRWDNDDNA